MPAPMKKFFTVLLVLALIALATILLWRATPSLSDLPTGPKPPTRNAAEETPVLHVGSTVLPLSAALDGSREDAYTKVTVQLENPGPGNLSLVADFADDILSGYADAFDPTRLSAEDQQIIAASAAGKYTLDLVGKKTAGLGGRWSYRLEVASYTGGAHGSFVVSARSYSQGGDALSLAEATGLRDPLTALANAVKPRLLDAVISKTRGQGGEAYQPDEDFNGGTAPTSENYSTWYLDGGDIVVVFNQYQIGSYALGEHEIGVPLASLR